MPSSPAKLLLATPLFWSLCNFLQSWVNLPNGHMRQFSLGESRLQGQPKATPRIGLTGGQAGLTSKFLMLLVFFSCNLQSQGGKRRRWGGGEGWGGMETK